MKMTVLEGLTNWSDPGFFHNMVGHRRESFLLFFSHSRIIIPQPKKPIPLGYTAEKVFSFSNTRVPLLREKRTKSRHCIVSLEGLVRGIKVMAMDNPSIALTRKTHVLLFCDWYSSYRTKEVFAVFAIILAGSQIVGSRQELV
jgi:hypothetical protein